MTESRAQKAQRLVDEGRVHDITTYPHATLAYVHGDSAHYITTIYASGSFFCTCEWGQRCNYSDDLCAHALAVKLAVANQ